MNIIFQTILAFEYSNIDVKIWEQSYIILRMDVQHTQTEASLNVELTPQSQEFNGLSFIKEVLLESDFFISLKLTCADMSESSACIAALSQASADIPGTLKIIDPQSVQVFEVLIPVQNNEPKLMTPMTMFLCISGAVLLFLGIIGGWVLYAYKSFQKNTKLAEQTSNLLVVDQTI
ncbi:Hypothetical_protein [Hexamita inflata]|uniref:Hypothetical_protein n=1 Tax=Hexamita inflata TaxID=28002 RepID=A0ABP1GKF4_9EUKA